MPDISGVEATKMIRNFTNKQRAIVPIIALSADVEASQQTQFIDAGMNSALGKPWKVEDLEKELKHLLRLG
jgi:CheY-like chemotaxis protein